MNPQLPDTIYLVNDLTEERAFAWADSDGIPVRSFANRADAEACCADFERERRAEANPFIYGTTLDDLTYLDADRFHDWILDAGLEPPAVDKELHRDDWVQWWEASCPTMTELQRGKMWQALAKLRFFHVVELRAVEGW